MRLSVSAMKRTSTSLVFLEVGLELPVGAYVPADQEPVRWLVGQHTRPAALAPIHAAVIQVAAHARLEHGLGDCDPQQIVRGAA